MEIWSTITKHINHKMEKISAIKWYQGLYLDRIKRKYLPFSINQAQKSKKIKLGIKMELEAAQIDEHT